MNVLITSASSKLRLIDAFQNAVQSSGGKVIAVDSNPACAAATFADHFHIIAHDDDEGYERSLFELCKQHEIGLIIPTRDGELTKLSAMQESFNDFDVFLPLPASDKLTNIIDKAKFYEFCLDNSFPVYERVKPDLNADWPLFARERNSAGGKGSRVIEGLQDWLKAGLNSDDVICQQVSTDKEYSIDVFLGFDSEPIKAVARQRCAVEYGESKVGVIVDNPELCAMALEISAKLGLKGHNLVQAFCSDDNDIHFIEVNARYGGGSMMSVAAGMNTPAWLLRLLEADEDNLQKAIENLKMSKISYGMKLTSSKSDPINYIRAYK